jgi:pimeloyl-ACP methyl ester carboxylesterase
MEDESPDRSWGVGCLGRLIPEAGDLMARPRRYRARAIRIAVLSLLPFAWSTAAFSSVAGSFTDANDTTGSSSWFDNTFAFGYTRSPIRLGRPSVSTTAGVAYLGLHVGGMSTINGDDCVPYNFALRWFSDSGYTVGVGSQALPPGLDQNYGPVTGSSRDAFYWMRFDSLDWNSNYYYELFGNCGDVSRVANFYVSSHPPNDWSQATAWNIMATTFDEATHLVSTDPSIVFQDDFNRASGPSLGSPWQLLTGTMLQVQNDQAEEVVAQQVEDMVIVGGVDLAQQTIDVDWAPTPASHDIGVDGRIVARVRDVGNYYGGRVAHGGTSDAIILYKVVNGVYSELARNDVSRVTSYPYHLLFTATDTSLAFQVSRRGSGDVVLTATDADIASGSAGLVAFAGWGGTDGRSSYDNFVLASASDTSAQPACGSPYGPDGDTVALWRLDDGAGATVAHDASGHHHDGAVQGTPGTMAGPFGSSFVLGQQGSGKWISVPSSSDLDGFAEVTVEAWIFPTDQIGGPHDLVAKGPHTGSNPSQVEFEYELNSVQPPPGDPAGLRFAFFVGGAAGSIEADSTITHPFNEWLYVAGTYDGHVARIYVNGQLEGVSSQVDGLSVSNTHPVLIDNQDVGSSPGDDGGIPGGFAEVRISKRARSAQEFVAAWANHSSSCAIDVDAGASTTIQVGQLATVSGASVSSSVCTPVLAWSFAGQPTGSAATLQNSGTLSPSFTPDVAGPYTLTLQASCGNLSQSAQVTINALACLGDEVFADARSAGVLVGGQQQFSANLPGVTYTWSLTQNNSGATLSPASGVAQTITYQAGNTPGMDTLHLSSSVCGGVDITITVYASQPPEPAVEVSPPITRGATSVTVTATFDTPPLAARFCLDGGSCSSMIPLSSTSFTATLQVGGLASGGKHQVSAQGQTVAGWGPAGSAELLVNQGTPILLLNGYNLDGCGPHPGQWFFPPNAQSVSIPCQIAQDFVGSAACPSQPDDCSSAYGVCVVTGVNGRGDISEAAQQLGDFIDGQPWLTAGGPPIIIGHSYGGQIARYYAAHHPSKVLAVVTLDTPHGGTLVAYLQKWLEGVIDGGIAGVINGDRCQGTCCDNALQYFLPGESAISLFDQLTALDAANPTPLYALASQVKPSLQSIASLALLPSVVGSFEVIYNQGDNVVPTDSQLGLGLTTCLQPAGSSATCVPAQFHSAHSIYTETDARTPPSNLHNGILEQPASWLGFYCDALAPTLNAILGTQVVPSACKSLGRPFAAEKRRGVAGRSGDSVVASATTPLPPAAQRRTVLSAAGTFDAADLQAAVAFPVDSATELAVLVDTANANPVATLTLPSSASITPTSVDGLTTFYSAGGGAGSTQQVFVVRNPAAGQWTLNLAVPTAGGGPHLPATGAQWTVTVMARSPLELGVTLGDTEYLPGGTVGVLATLDVSGAPVTGATVSASVLSASGTVVNSLMLFDDGQHGDGAAGDGIYGGSFIAGDPGAYTVAVSASGSSTVGTFSRQTNITFSVGAAGATVAGPFVEASPDADGDGKFDSLDWSFTVNVPAAGTYTCYGDLLAADGSRVTKAVATFTAGAAGSFPIGLSFPGLEIYRQAKLGPYTLANLRIAMSTPNGERLAGRPADTVVSGGPYWSWMSFQRDPVPAFTWTSPVVEQVVTGNSFTLQWSVFDGNGATTLDLFYDTTGAGFAGTAIATGIPATQGAMSYTWDLSGLPDGVYYVYARVRNGDFSNAVYGGDVRRLLDSDGDGMPDAWEMAHGLNPNDPSDAYLDPDGDGLANLDEYVNGTDPHVADTDGGGEPDLSEAVNGRDGTNPADDVTGITIVTVAPGEGDGRGGEQALVLGSGFQPGATVSFDNQPAANVTFINSTRLVVTTPAHAFGAAAVTVTNPAAGGAATLPAGFSFLCDFVEPPAATNSGPFCPGATLQLNATGPSGAAFQWTGPDGFASTLQNPTIPNAGAAAAGQYTVTMTVGSCQLQGVTTVAVSAAPSAPTASNNGPLCAGQDLQLSASTVSGATYSWTGPNGFTSDQQNPLLQSAGSASAGTYSVAATAGRCSSPQATTEVVVHPLPTAIVSGSTESCAGAPDTIQATLTGTAPWNLAWSDGLNQPAVGTSPATRSVEPTSNTIYTVTGVADAYCSGTSSGEAAITINPACMRFSTVTPCRVFEGRRSNTGWREPSLWRDSAASRQAPERSR